MVSVRCIRPGLPGGNSMTAKREPFSGGGVPITRAPRSSMSSPIATSAGVESVDQISVEVAPEAPCLVLVAGASMITLATLLLSWPVTTRRIGGSFLASFILVLIVLAPRPQLSTLRLLESHVVIVGYAGAASSSLAPEGRGMG